MGRKSRKKAPLPFCVISHKAVNRSWFATEAEAVAHASTLDEKRSQWFRSKYGDVNCKTEPPTEFAIVRVTATVGPKPPVEPPVAVSYYR